MHLSLCLIARDEAAHLGACLDSLQGVADELCVLDTGSSDATVSVAEARGARVGRFEWCDDFAAARNASLELASEGWVLVLDADERLVTDPERARAELEDFAREHPAHAGRVLLENRVEGRLQSRARLTRLVPPGIGLRFTGRVHEQLATPDGTPVARADVDLCVQHAGYATGTLAARDKLTRNARLLERALEDAGDDGYLWFQLGRTRALAGDPAAALESLEAALTRCPDDAPWGIAALEEGAYALRALDASAQALALLESVEDQWRRRADTCFLLALLAMDTGNLQRAERGFRRCLELADEPAGAIESSRAAATSAPAFNLGVLFEVSGRPREALQQYRRALAFEPDHGPSLEALERVRAASRAAAAAASPLGTSRGLR